MFEVISVWFWTQFRNLRTFRVRLKNVNHILCYLGIHKMRRGFGWSGKQRMDICLRENCNFTIWYDDKIGNELVKINKR